MGLRDVVYGVYERRLLHTLADTPRPRHVGVILDGNRRWAKAAGADDVATGHRRGADKIEDLLAWCTDAGVEVVTLWLLSTDNLNRPQGELEPLSSVGLVVKQVAFQPEKLRRLRVRRGKGGLAGPLIRIVAS